MVEFQEASYSANGSISSKATTDAAITGNEDASAAAGSTSLVHTMLRYVPSVDTMKEKGLEVWSRSKPWGEFINTSQMKLVVNPGELKDRMVENFQYYFYNYLVILIILSILTILTSPLSILGGVFILVGYVYLFIMNPEPIHFGGMELDNKGKMFVVVLLSLVVLWITGAGATFTGLLFTMGVLSSIHAALRKAHSEVDFETAYEPANLNI
eukprot:CAMPEP_0184691594 /NCGR_PEP_ID=MMETSP0313-20130426/399_1 /TAXON_ID=2792 /ORGANISM="Porphyridium aerugineum, Strain SAG 1380-2" /LENGTH=211 /DNA_ID=CAMNT_0027149339 /DNA_START=128 /DNA_END=763 /DNA_ORIENTATION=+